MNLNLRWPTHDNAQNVLVMHLLQMNNNIWRADMEKKKQKNIWKCQTISSHLYNRMTCVEVKKEALFLLTRFRKCFVRNVMTIVSISLSMGHLLRNYRRIIHLDGSWNALSYILLPLLFSCESRALLTDIFTSQFNSPSGPKIWILFWTH